MSSPRLPAERSRAGIGAGIAVALLTAVAACGGDSGPGQLDASVDGAAVDGPVVDGTVVDGPVVDGPAVDGAEVDGAVVDGAVVDGAEVDGALVDASAPDAGQVDASVDAPPLDAPPLDALTPDASACGSTSATDVYVDRAASGPSLGTALCPYHTIREATTLPAPAVGGARTIHVAGASPAASYVEAGLVVVGARVTLVGSGEAQVTISGGGTCAYYAGPCTLSVQDGGAVQGVTVTSATGHAIEVGGSGIGALAHVTATDAAQVGFLIRGAATLDSVTAHRPQGNGLDARNAAVTIQASTFEYSQGGWGVRIDQGATLTLTGGSITGNALGGVQLQNGSQFVVLAHAITGAQVLQNLGYGVQVASNASLRLRGTTLLSNEAGVVLAVGASNQLDLGTAAAPGGNVLAGASPGQSNVRAGLCLEQSGATATQAIEGDSWRSCPPTTRKITTSFTCHATGAYADLVYLPAVATSGSPFLSPAACTVGP
ncbi:MAG: right-handed parallel beta-helix repeat-containing protein [Myxococcales bacterium]|nr:right-handed parallel beta-helix repeat-containing protein [Myxococcales bacterium]